MPGRNACIVALVLLLPSTVGAQGPFAVGLRAGYDHRAAAPSGGVELQIHLSDRLAIRPSVDLFALESGSGKYRAYNLDLQYSVTRGLYVGGGLASRWFSASDVAGDVLGVNLFAGAQLAANPLELFVEGRLFTKSGTTGAIVGGVRFRL
jgi:hypothetical protein